MHFIIILNRDGGTLKTLDVEQFAGHVRSMLETGGHKASTHVVGAEDIEKALEDAVSGTCDVVMVGGGDGTVSAAAGKLMGTDKALAVLPAGTMNLFARSLAIPLDLDEAVAVFCTGQIHAVDLGSADGRIFVHQFSIGLHEKLIRFREKAVFHSKIGKMRASIQAGAAAFFNPPSLLMRLDIDGREVTVKTVSIGISNNLFGEGHLPYADIPDRGILGVYAGHARSRFDLALFALKALLGWWRSNDNVDIYEAENVKLTVLSSGDGFGCAIDGELCDLANETILCIHPGSLKVLVP